MADLAAGRATVAASLVSIARTRLADAGLLSRSAGGEVNAELTLYRLLMSEGGDAYSRYKALTRELASFTFALDRRLRRTS